MEAERTTISFEEVKALLEEHFAQLLKYNNNKDCYGCLGQLSQINQSICLTALTLFALDKEIKARDEKKAVKQQTDIKELPKAETQAVNLTKAEIVSLSRVLRCYQQSLDEVRKKYQVGVGCNCNLFEIDRKMRDAFQKFEEIDSQSTEAESVSYEKSDFTELQKQISELATRVAANDKVLKHYGVSEDTDGIVLIFDSTKIESIGIVVAQILKETKGTAEIHYDPNYPRSVIRIYNQVR